MERKYRKANDMLELVGQTGKCTFVVYDLIGRGSMSVGYRAFKREAERNCFRMLYEFCPKALQPGSVVFEHEKQRFLRTLAFQYRNEIGCGCAEPVFPASALFEDPGSGSLWAETDWVESKPLAFVPEERSSLCSLFRTMLLLLDAIDHYHESGYLLLSLKPQNIWVRSAESGKESIRILDFGSMIEKAAVADRVKRRNTLISFSRKWSAPELLRFDGKMAIDEKADVFSAGAVLYSCLCGGKLPVLYSDIPLSLSRDIAANAFSGTAETNSLILEAISELLSGMLEPDPAKRSDAAEVLAMINGIIGELSKNRAENARKNGSLVRV